MPLTKRLRSLTEKKSNGPKTRPLDDFIIVNIPKKERCAGKKYIPKGDTVLEYCGVIRTDEPHQSEDDTYIFECVFKGKQYWLDATHDDGSLGRLINDDRKPNLKPKMVPICGEPHIFFYAIRDIHPREELLYCYGNGPYPWRNTTNVKDAPNDLVSSIQKDSIPVTETDDTATYSSNEPASDISVSMVNIPASATDASKPDNDFCFCCSNNETDSIYGNNFIFSHNF
ncbi:N-lysine methyltransferase KMT5A-like [Ylistrum balloti]|uniref:N-lysine methyltransferase KMT5A-like n=1 Tax=Ylistrum balloti TaxID=509963 RepID=UPI002905A3CF|nr:N-lysine methyltransferase KMT5A-like [Ylistrum balloti]